MSSEWKTVTVESIAESMGDAPFGSSLKNEDYVEFGALVVQGKNIAGRCCDWSDTRYVRLEKYDQLKRSHCEIGDLVFPKVGTIGKVGVLTSKQGVTKYLLSTNTMRLRLSENVDSNFVYYYFSWPRTSETIQAMNSKSVQPVFNYTSLKKFEIHLPSLPLQRSIAKVLSSLDDKIDLLHRQNKTLEAMAETLVRQWFVEEARDDWRIVTFAEHFEAFRGLSYKGSGLTECGLGTPMHNLNSVYEGGGYKETGIKYYSGDFKERHVVHAGDVIVTNTEQGHEFRLIGFPAIVPKYFGESGIFSQHIYRVVPKETTYLTRDFLYHLIKENDVREQIISATNGSTVNMLAIDGLQRPTFRLPPEPLVLRFDEIASEAREKRELNHNTIRNLEKLRDMLLPKLMSGEVRVEYE